MIVGRPQLGGLDVSLKHAVARRIGPETYMSDRSANGTFRQGGGQWQQFEKGKEYLIEAGDRLRFASVEAWVESVS